MAVCAAAPIYITRRRYPSSKVLGITILVCLCALCVLALLYPFIGMTWLVRPALRLRSGYLPRKDCRSRIHFTRATLLRRRRLFSMAQSTRHSTELFRSALVHYDVHLSPLTVGLPAKCHPLFTAAFLVCYSTISSDTTPLVLLQLPHHSGARALTSYWDAQRTTPGTL